MPTTPLRDRPSWKALEQHYSEISGRPLRELFAEDPARGERLTAEAAGLYLDYSKNRITDETLRLLIQLAQESGLEQRRDMMFGGGPINVSENRAVLHIALRMPKGSSLVVDGVDVVPQVHEVLDRMSAFAERIRSGEWKGISRQKYKAHCQCRHRRLGSRPGDGLRGAASLPPPRPDIPLRVERRLDRFRRGNPRSVPRRDAVHHLVQDLRHPGDAHQRPLGARLGGRPARQRGCDR